MTLTRVFKYLASSIASNKLHISNKTFLIGRGSPEGGVVPYFFLKGEIANTTVRIPGQYRSIISTYQYFPPH